MPALLTARWAATLAALALWATSIPWLAEALGQELDVATRLEIADHVIPGLLLLAVAGLLAIGSPPSGSTSWLGAGALVFLSGLWITATHVPLIPGALDGTAPVGAALLHLSAGPPVLAAGLWMMLARPPETAAS